MSTDDKAGKDGKKEGRAEKQRLSYLKSRAKELKLEIEKIKVESVALREKLGKNKPDKEARAAKKAKKATSAG